MNVEEFRKFLDHLPEEELTKVINYASSLTSDDAWFEWYLQRFAEMLMYENCTINDCLSSHPI